LPLMKPEIQRALRSLDTASAVSGTETVGSLVSILDRAGLSLEDCISELSDIAKDGDTSTVRKGAIDTALKLHGVLKDQAPPPPSVTIVIQDPANAGLDNPILLPRQLTTSSLQLNSQEKVVN
jgi:hypothetical protein